MQCDITRWACVRAMSHWNAMRHHPMGMRTRNVSLKCNATLRDGCNPRYWALAQASTHLDNWVGHKNDRGAKLMFRKSHHNMDDEIWESVQFWANCTKLYWPCLKTHVVFANLWHNFPDVLARVPNLCLCMLSPHSLFTHTVRNTNTASVWHTLSCT